MLCEIVKPSFLFFLAVAILHAYRLRPGVFDDVGIRAFLCRQFRWWPPLSLSREIATELYLLCILYMCKCIDCKDTPPVTAPGHSSQRGKRSYIELCIPLGGNMRKSKQTTTSARPYSSAPESLLNLGRCNASASSSLTRAAKSLSATISFVPYVGSR